MHVKLIDMQQFSIWIVKTPIYWHTGMIVGELARSLQAAFEELGYKNTPIVDQASEIKGCGIVLCSNLLPSISETLPSRLILYNHEQVQQNSPWMTTGHIELFRKFPIWDYSGLNMKNLEKKGISNTTLCRIGYMPVLSHISPQNEDIDVLFYGTLNRRRETILDQLKKAGLKVHVASAVYGDELDNLIARAKIVINIHFYEAKVFEIVRVSYLLANRKCVVSERGADDDLEAPLSQGVSFVEYKDLVATCLSLLEQPKKRRAMAEKGFESFKNISQTETLKDAIEHTVELN